MKQLLEKAIMEVVSQEFGEQVASNVSFTVSSPPKPDMGDYASNVAMVIAKQVGKNPKEAAERIVDRISNFQFPISKIEVVGGFINFTVKSEAWFKEVVEEIKNQKSEYGKSTSAHPENIMVEYLSPNTNKPLHLGHMRNGVTGIATMNVLAAQGHTIIKVGIINDRGVHICKAMLAYEKWGGGSTPESTGKKPDHFVGDWYVRFAQEAEKTPSLNDEAQDMLRKWEAGDVEVRKLWTDIRDWVLAGWKQTEQVLGFSYDKPYFESDVYQQGKDIVEQGLSKGVFRKNEAGNVVFDLSAEEFGQDEHGNNRLITVLRADGTSLYTTQDLGLAVKRAEEFNLHRLVYVVGSEQRFHFESLFAMLRALGYGWANKLYHLWYGMVYLPDGKMKSREGTVVDADDLIIQMIDLARNEILSRLKNAEGVNEISNFQFPISNEEIEHRAKVIALAAIKFYLLKQKPTTDINFDPKESISFEGFTGPYCLYTYARAKSILRAAGVMPRRDVGTSRNKEVDSGSSLETAQEVGMTSGSVNYSLLGDTQERLLLQKLEVFPEVIARAAQEYNAALVAVYIFETAQIFNTFYTTNPVLKAENPELVSARLALVECTAQVLQNGLALLGIEVLEEM